MTCERCPTCGKPRDGLFQTATGLYEHVRHLDTGGLKEAIFGFFTGKPKPPVEYDL